MNQLLKVDINYFDESFRSQIAPTALGFLQQLDGLSIFDIKIDTRLKLKKIKTPFAYSSNLKNTLLSLDKIREVVELK